LAAVDHSRTLLRNFRFVV